MRQFETYGGTIPGLSLNDLTGWLIVIEGTDGVGRTTHIRRLRAHQLFAQGKGLGEAALGLGLAPGAQGDFAQVVVRHGEVSHPVGVGGMPNP